MTAAILALGLIVTVAFSAIGLARGWRREAWTLGALAVVWMLALGAGPLLVGLVNGAGRSLGFVLSGGLTTSNPEPIWRSLALRPLVDPARPELLVAALFAIAVVASYAVPGRRGQVTAGFGDRFVGLAMGCVNGYLVACALLKYGVPTAFGADARVAADQFGKFALLALGLATTMLAVYAWMHMRPSHVRGARKRATAPRPGQRRRKTRQTQAGQR